MNLQELLKEVEEYPQGTSTRRDQCPVFFLHGLPMTCEDLESQTLPRCKLQTVAMVILYSASKDSIAVDGREFIILQLRPSIFPQGQQDLGSQTQLPPFPCHLTAC